MWPGLLCAAALAAAVAAPASPPVPAPAPTPDEARAFAARVSDELRRLGIRAQTAAWIQSTYITGDTERNSAAAAEDLMAFTAEASRESRRYDGPATDPVTRRMLLLLRVGQTLPAPADPARRAELATLASRLEAAYGEGKWCGATPGGACRDLQALEATMARSRDWDELLDAWVGWRTVARPMRPLFRRLVELGNEGARELGARDLGELWRSGYDMSPAAFERELDRLWGEVEPFYRDLHCYARAALQRRYGAARVPDGRPIPAHLLGNMWAQDWENLYPDLEPYPGHAGGDVDGALAAQGWDPVRMVRLGEAFFVSLGFAPLPATFWERSMLVKPRDREVVCHASAWDVTASGDLRVKMCIRPTGEDLITIHHELGHNFYQRAYLDQPYLFQGGANDGFHEAIGDAIALSITPGYLRRVGLLAEVPEDEEGLIDVQLRRALSKVAFLPFARVVDGWRWGVFSGAIPPDRYDAAWWELRERVQGVAAPVARSEADFDPGAKYHVAATVPYARYFLAAIYQFQFHQALCQAAGWKGPLHECSIYGSREAGRALEAMLRLGASRPWPEAYAALTGTTRPSAAALLEYFAPLRAWLRKANAGRRCGW